MKTQSESSKTSKLFCSLPSPDKLLDKELTLKVTLLLNSRKIGDLIYAIS